MPNDIYIRPRRRITSRSRSRSRSKSKSRSRSRSKLLSKEQDKSEPIVRKSLRKRKPLYKEDLDTNSPVKKRTTRKRQKVSGDRYKEQSNSKLIADLNKSSDKKNFVTTLAMHWKITPLEILKYMVNPSYDFPYARSIMNDFVTLLRNEGNDPSNKNGINNRGIDTTIISNCKKNFEKKTNNICFCCGEPIFASSKKACDHVIPIITMLVTIDPESVKDNLHFIHEKCNLQKKNIDIWTTFNEIGNPKGRFKNLIPDKNNPEVRIQLCREIFMNILTSMSVRPIRDIKQRSDSLIALKEKLYDFKDTINLYLDPTVSAKILQNIRNNVLEERIEKPCPNNPSPKQIKSAPQNNLELLALAANKAD